MDYSECRKHGSHDWQPTDDSNVEVCARCQTERVSSNAGRMYRFPKGYVGNPLDAYDNCEVLEHNWRQIRVVKEDDAITQLLTCDRCLAKCKRVLSSKGELLSEVVTTVGEIIFDHVFTGKNLRECATCGRPAGDHQYSLPEEATGDE